MTNDLELAACKPNPVDLDGFNTKAQLPCGCTIRHIRQAMTNFVGFLGFINQQLHTKGMARLESMLVPANFSSMVGEFMGSSIPKYCPTIAKNKYHNGYPDLIPSGRFPNDSVKHTSEGIEIKASRYLKGWQGHNPEDCFLLVFVFDSSRPSDQAKHIKPRPFNFLMVVGAALRKRDWLFAGRSRTSRRTITASVRESGHKKMMANWIYRSPELRVGK